MHLIHLRFRCYFFDNMNAIARNINMFINTNKILKKGGVIMGNKEKELEVEIKGYGCDDDCEQYFEKTASKDCGWKETDNTWPLW